MNDPRRLEWIRKPYIPPEGCHAGCMKMGFSPRPPVVVFKEEKKGWISRIWEWVKRLFDKG